MKRGLLEVSAFVCVAAAAAMAQSKPPATPTQRLVANVDVHVINLDVVVTDKKGNPVRGLTKDDFLIYENGSPKAVSNFYEVTSPTTPVTATAPVPVTTGTAIAAVAPPPDEAEVPEHLRRKFILFIDNLSLAPFNRNTVFRSMKTFIHSAMRPGDQAMIATFNNDMKVRLPFTPDAKQIEQTLDVIAGESAFGLHHDSERNDVQENIRNASSYDDAIAHARAYAESVEHDTEGTVKALNALLGTLAGVDGKKVLLLTSEGLPMEAGKEMFYYIDDQQKTRTDWQSNGSALMESSNFDESGLVSSIARAANANGITIYALHAGGLNSYNNMSAENAQPQEITTQQASLSNSTDSMRMLAEMTGGLATVGTSNWTSAFQQIKNDLESYYSLGYRSETERVDRQRSVEVRAKNRNYQVRSRTSFVEKSLTTEMNDRVIANVFYENHANDMKVFLTTKTPVQQEDGNFKVPVDVQIPMESLTLLPTGEVMTGSFTVYVVVANKLGDMSDVKQQNHEVTVPADKMNDLKGKYYTYELELVMDKGRNKISVGVVDDISSSTGFQKQEVLADDLR